ncbi:hypothetical protein G9C85_04705 [Halorubellus sp. JP-L1]|uniref:DUF7310 family coiled-coil domain-containing protein n=1 Tax=Halorubellus sp. JP-L1 TaxID=2715753 RepID=UPI00140CACB1|nr:hypothetical protein [Halorubellus sp. JP-L1]NHN40936.1 hypothetical protein [Halorubellus sp. JP-L1]
MTDIDRIEERLTAVERTVVDGDYELDELADVAALADQFEEVEERLAEVEDRLAKLEGRSQALGGYVSNVQSVNDDVADQASAALATVDRLEDRLAELEGAPGSDGDRREPSNESAGDRSTDANRTPDASRSRSPSTAGSSVSDTVDDLFPEDDANARSAGSGNATSPSQPPHASNTGPDEGGRRTRNDRADDAASPRRPERGPANGSTGGQQPPDATANSSVDGSNGHRDVAGDRSRDDQREGADDRTIEQRFGEDAERDDAPEDGTTTDADADDDDGGFFGSLRSSLS